jgi:transcriptional regulator with XRE-family HTH domain
MFANLKLQIWKAGLRQNRLAQMVGIDETLLSRILNGFRQPDAKIRTQIATILQADETWLFAPTNSPAPEGRRNAEGPAERRSRPTQGLPSKP